MWRNWRRTARKILLSFHGDVYQPAEDKLQLTRQALQLLRAADLPFTVLTKRRAARDRDFDILEGHSKARFGTHADFYGSIGSRLLGARSRECFR
ncbi:MAG: hypothetical protein R2874_16195 [Desulfobacterales bacterium]